MTRMPRSILSGLITLALTPLTAHALGFGELLRQSAIGEPFRAEFELLNVAGDTAGCVRVIPSQMGDGIPDLRVATTRIENNGRRSRLVVTTNQPVSDPVLRVTLEEICDARLTRTYTLLLPMAATTVAPPAEQRASSGSPAPTRKSAPPPLISPSDLGRSYTLTRGASLNQLASTLYPSSRSERLAFIAAMRELNVGDRSLRSSRRRLEAGSTYLLPSANDVASMRDRIRARAAADKATSTPASSLAPPAPAVAPSASAAATTPLPESTPPQTSPERTDRLVLMGGSPEASGFKLSTRLGDPGLTERTTDAERDALRREQQLIMTLDSQIMTRLELADRIERLEALQQVLRAEMAAADGAPTEDAAPDATLPAEPAPASPTADIAPTVDAAPPEIPPQAPPPEALQTDTFRWWPYALAALLALLAFSWVRRKRQDDASDYLNEPDEARVETGSPRTEASVSETLAPLGPGNVGSDSFDFSHAEWEGAPPGEIEHSVSPIVVEEDELVEEHESAVELADIMMSFGRVQGAAETLADFIRGNPKKAVQPWIKLLEVYKTAHMRGEFDALSDKLNKTFNVKAVTWESFDRVKRATESIEQLPHILNAVKTNWMTPECQLYIQKLLRDNRGGTREGFPLGIVDDLLTLQSVLEDQLGPYRISDEELDALIAASAAAQTGAAAVREQAPASNDNDGVPTLDFDERDSLAPDIDFDSPAEDAGQDDAFKDIFDSQSNTTLDLPDLDFQLDDDTAPSRDKEDNFEHTRIFRRDDDKA